MKWHLVHDWSKWEMVCDDDGKAEITRVFEYEGASLPEHQYFRMERACELCDLMQVKRVRL